MGYTGETAEYFQLFHVTSRIERFEAELEQRKAAMSAAAAATATPKKAKAKGKGKGGSSSSSSKKKGKGAEEEEKEGVAENGVAAGAGASDAEGAGGLVKELFPFHGFFANAPAGDKLFGGNDLAEDLEVARGCFRHIDKVSFCLLLLLSMLLSVALDVCLLWMILRLLVFFLSPYCIATESSYCPTQYKAQNVNLSLS